MHGPGRRQCLVILTTFYHVCHLLYSATGDVVIVVYTNYYFSAPGVFVGTMDKNGFAFKSGKLHYMDRILACNGVDFTRKNHSEPVKDIFYRMAKEPLLRIAIGRGVHIPVTADNGGTKEEPNENGRNLKFYLATHQSKIACYSNSTTKFLLMQ